MDLNDKNKPQITKKLIGSLCNRQKTLALAIYGQDLLRNGPCDVVQGLGLSPIAERIWVVGGNKWRRQKGKKHHGILHISQEKGLEAKMCMHVSGTCTSQYNRFPTPYSCTPSFPSK